VVLVARRVGTRCLQRDDDEECGSEANRAHRAPGSKGGSDEARRAAALEDGCEMCAKHDRSPLTVRAPIPEDVGNDDSSSARDVAPHQGMPVPALRRHPVPRLPHLRRQRDRSRGARFVRAGAHKPIEIRKNVLAPG